MRKNRKMPKKMSVMTRTTVCFGAVVVMLFVMVILNLLASSSCQQLMKSIGEKERVLAKCEEARQRESARWEELKAPEKIETALLRHGLAMRYARADQVVRMKADGTPFPGSPAVAKANQRNAGYLAMTDTSYHSSRVKAPTAPKVRRSQTRRAR